MTAAGTEEEGGSKVEEEDNKSTFMQGHLMSISTKLFISYHPQLTDSVITIHLLSSPAD